jgi:hypothetical protein
MTRPWLLALLLPALLLGCPDETVDDDAAVDDDTGDDDTSVIDDDTGDDDTAVTDDDTGDDDTAVTDDDTGDDDTEEPDSDGDGWADSSDCEPHDPAVYPGAPEACNGLDDDCDGVLPPDEIDGDGDGFMPCDGDCDDADDAVHPGAAEACNGVDDDCDGTIPADELDADGDGYTGCVDDCDDTDADVNPAADEDWYDGIDSDCDGLDDPDPCDEEPPQTSVPQLGTCTYTPPVGVFTPEVEWRTDTWTELPAYDQFMAQPVVANVTDDNGDGMIDAEDVPDILACAFTGGGYGSAGVLRALSGDGSGEHWAIQTVGSASVFGGASIAVGDIDGDGLPEIVTMDTDGVPVCISHDGQYEWTGNGPGGMNGASPAIADLDQDGTAEIVIGHRIWSHLGDVEGEGAYGTGTNYTEYWYCSSAVADVDADGVLDVVVGNAVYDIHGNALWANGQSDGNPAVADFDGDPGGEIAVVYAGTLRLQDDDGSILWGPITLAGGAGGGPPTIADYDGDGLPEIGVAGNSAYDVYDGDGSLLWSNPTQDGSSQRTGSSVFDFDGDGVAEVVYADELYLYIYSGPDGTVLYQETDHASGTLMEYPVIADVDADGNAEIVLISNNYTFPGWTGVTVIGDTYDNWVAARPIWNQHAYRITNVMDDGSIPAVEAANWPTYNSFRQGGFGTLNPLDGPDVIAESLGVCVELCPDEFTWMLRLANQGASDLPAGLWIALYAEDGGGVRTLLDLVQTTAPMVAGQTSETLSIDLDVLTLTGLGATSVVAVGDDIGTGAGEHNECDEANNEVALALPACP